MYLLLCSDFAGVGYRFLPYFYINGRGKTVLFVGYACEDDSEMFVTDAVKRFEDVGFKVIFLTPDYDFKEDVDVVYVRGGNTTKLIDYLKKYNQFDALKDAVRYGALYIGSSAGAVLAGTDTEWTLESEPYPVDMKAKYGKDALLGFGFVPKVVLVHASKFRMCRSYEAPNGEKFLTLDTDCYPAFLVERKKFKRKEAIQIANNEAYIVQGDVVKKPKYHWQALPKRI